MVPAKELMIGNYVLYGPSENEGKICRVKTAGDTEIIIESGKFIKGVGQFVKSCLPEDLFPINIYPGLLKKLGFTQEKDYWLKDGARWPEHTDPKTNKFFISHLVIWQNNQVQPFDIYSLHQLQNLYFSITRNELDISF